jgi:hypothetical protein
LTVVEIQHRVSAPDGFIRPEAVNRRQRFEVVTRRSGIEEDAVSLTTHDAAGGGGHVRKEEKLYLGHRWCT